MIKLIIIFLKCSRYMKGFQIDLLIYRLPNGGNLEKKTSSMANITKYFWIYVYIKSYLRIDLIYEIYAYKYLSWCMYVLFMIYTLIYLQYVYYIFYLVSYTQFNLFYDPLTSFFILIYLSSSIFYKSNVKIFELYLSIPFLYF